MICLSFDLSRHTGFCAYDGNEFATGTIEFHDLVQFRTDLTNTVVYWQPEIVVTAFPYSPNRQGLFTQANYSAILELVCQEQGKQFACLRGEHNEPHIKKMIFGKGKVSKEEIMARYKQSNEHCGDSAMFCDYAWRYILQK